MQFEVDRPAQGAASRRFGGAASMRFLYLGFSQQASIRCYRFQGVAPREHLARPSPNVEFRLRADLELLALYQIRIQDGPTLCLQILNAGLAAPQDGAKPFATYAITREDVSAFASAQATKHESKTFRRRPRPGFKPSASSQLKWPRVR